VSTVAVLPIKRFEHAKQRLDRPAKDALAAGMATDVLRALAGAARLDRVLVVTGDATARQRAAEHGAEVVAEPSLAGHSGAATLGVTRAIELGATRVLLVPGDCPLLRPEDIDGLLARHEGPGVVVVPDRHRTGTNALLLSPPDAIAPAFGPGSCERHVGLARAAGVAVSIDEVPALLLDVDTLEDLDVVAAALDGPAPAAQTRSVLAA
jgi:2-phospho-L-lactate guanylyltransferase